MAAPPAGQSKGVGLTEGDDPVQTMAATRSEVRPKAQSESDPPLQISDSDYPRGRSKLRQPAKQALATTKNQGGTGESGTFRGRTRWRSTSRPGAQRKTPARAQSPAARLIMRVAMKNRRRSHSPSGSRPRDMEWRRGIRRRERSISRSINLEDEVRWEGGIQGR